jgi:hypothetical protein
LALAIREVGDIVSNLAFRAEQNGLKGSA